MAIFFIFIMERRLMNRWTGASHWLTGVFREIRMRQDWTGPIHWIPFRRNSLRGGRETIGARCFR